MEIWLDTINKEAILQALRMGILKGVTTNPSILAASPKSVEETIQELLDIQPGPVTVQVIGENPNDMVRQGMWLQELSTRIIIKVPVTPQGLEAMTTLRNKHIATMATVVFHPNQALLAATAGAEYIAPYVSRIALSGEDPFDFLHAMLDIIHHHSSSSKILAASIKTTAQIMQCASIGVDAITIKESLFQELIVISEDTQECIDIFAEDMKELI